MWPFKQELFTVRLFLPPLCSKVGRRKDMEKFFKKYFSGCGNYAQCVSILNNISDTRVGGIHIYAEIPQKKFKALEKDLAKDKRVGLAVGVSFHLNNTSENIRMHYSLQRKPWVILAT